MDFNIVRLCPRPRTVLLILFFIVALFLIINIWLNINSSIVVGSLKNQSKSLYLQLERMDEKNTFEWHDFFTSENSPRALKSYKCLVGKMKTGTLMLALFDENQSFFAPKMILVFRDERGVTVIADD